jgi:hypothetical protein
MALSGMFDAFAADDEDRIAGLDVNYEPVHSPQAPRWVRKAWRLEAEAELPIIKSLIASDSDG